MRFWLLCDSLCHTVQDSLQQVPITLSLLQLIVSLMHRGPRSNHCVISLINGEWLTSAHLSRWPTLPPHLRSARPRAAPKKWTRNRSSAGRFVPEKIECCVCDWSCIEMKWNIFFMSCTDLCTTLELRGIWNVVHPEWNTTFSTTFYAVQNILCWETNV